MTEESQPIDNGADVGRDLQFLFVGNKNKQDHLP